MKRRINLSGVIGKKKFAKKSKREKLPKEFYIFAINESNTVETKMLLILFFSFVLILLMDSNHFYYVLMNWVFFHRETNAEKNYERKENRLQIVSISCQTCFYTSFSFQDLLMETVFSALVQYTQKMQRNRKKKYIREYLEHSLGFHRNFAVQNDVRLMIITGWT